MMESYESYLGLMARVFKFTFLIISHEFNISGGQNKNL